MQKKTSAASTSEIEIFQADSEKSRVHEPEQSHICLDEHNTLQCVPDSHQETFVAMTARSDSVEISTIEEVAVCLDEMEDESCSNDRNPFLNSGYNELNAEQNLVDEPNSVALTQDLAAFLPSSGSGYGIGLDLDQLMIPEITEQLG